LETTLTVSQQVVDIGGGVLANAEVFNGGIPGPTFYLNVGDTVVVRLVNNLPYIFGIHWHGVELENYSDGTEITQNAAAAAPIPNGAVSGGTFLYKFQAHRAGIFWYHPHHGNSINRVFRGLYGMIVVTDPLETSIVGTVLPADTVELVLSDITVCKAPGQNDTATYANADPTAEWLSFSSSGQKVQFPPPPALPINPIDFCELSPVDDDGNPTSAYAAGDVPSIVPTGPVVRVEGQTVLTNGVNVGGRAGAPGAPLGLAPGASTRGVVPGQGLRMRILNAAHLRYFRLRLTTGAGAPVNLQRIGGEGGLLDTPVLDGGTLGTVPDPSKGPFFESGELMIPPGGRADVVAVIPPGLSGTTLTLWTRDCQRTGGGAGADNWAEIPTVPVMHLQVGAGSASYSLPNTTQLRALAGMQPVEQLPSGGSLLSPPFGFAGSSSSEIKFQAGGNPTIDGVSGMDLMMDSNTMMPYPQYTDAPHIGSTRYAEHLKVLDLLITNTTQAHHPFHLHGFSFQPLNIQPEGGGAALYNWPYNEFRDTIDLLPHTTLAIRVRLENRPLADGMTAGGEFGRWLFHCHIFFHHTHGMISELVVTSASGNAKPNVNVGGSFAWAPQGTPATRFGTFHHPDPGANVTSLTAINKGNLIPTPALPAHEGTWTWSYTPVAADPEYDYVYIQASDGTRNDQAVFRLHKSASDVSHDIGDPHIRTVDGTLYDFQAAGEFTLIRDVEGMEVQTRQTPAVTPPPIKDKYTGLTECVSLNSAVAARVGSHRISYQPFRETRLQFFLDGKPADLPRAGMFLGAHLVSAFDAGGETAIRIDYAHGPVVIVTPHFWSNYGIHYLDVEVSNSDADWGLMGKIHPGTWLPNLQNGATVGPMPASLHDRYVALYQTFADSWRVTDAASLFMYTPARSTAFYTDKNWPPQKPPCTSVKPGFPLPVHPIRENIPVSRAKQICKDVKLEDLNAACVFDVASTGDPEFAKHYLLAQDLRLRATAIKVVGNVPHTQPGEELVALATVVALTRIPQRPALTGSVTFFVDDQPMKPTILDAHGRALFKTARLEPGEHKVRATYSGSNDYSPCSSPILYHLVAKQRASGKKPVKKTGSTVKTMTKAKTKKKRETSR
jgi:FtsP/CotA-like multicopper oxidase with cupredoxin domain